jgi:hypothetical protein
MTERKIMEILENLAISTFSDIKWGPDLGFLVDNPLKLTGVISFVVALAILIAFLVELGNTAMSENQQQGGMLALFKRFGWIAAAFVFGISALMYIMGLQ